VVKIYTKTGDTGETGLLGAGRVPKDHPRVAAYGDVDELNAALGLALALEPRDFARPLLERVQRSLLTVGAELASPDPGTRAATLPGAPIGPTDIRAIENDIDSFETHLEPLKNFILPGGTPKAAALHVARTVCRRAERGVIALSHQGALNGSLVPYLNRLSDLLFVLARAANAQAGLPDVKW